MKKHLKMHKYVAGGCAPPGVDVLSLQQWVVKLLSTVLYYNLLFPAGVGVPLMLTYVYGVVPMSLCRNGWCRSQSEPPETHKIQLEDLASCEYATSSRHLQAVPH